MKKNSISDLTNRAGKEHPVSTLVGKYHSKVFDPTSPKATEPLHRVAELFLRKWDEISDLKTEDGIINWLDGHINSWRGWKKETREIKEVARGFRGCPGKWPD